MQRKLERASVALGRLDGIGRLLPGPDELLYSYVRKEAVLSSQIEGTQSSLADLLLHENSVAPGVPTIYQQVALHTNVAVYDYLKARIAIRVPEAAAACGTTKPTVARALEDLERLGIAHEVTGKPRNRVYVYQEYLEILNRDAVDAR